MSERCGGGGGGGGGNGGRRREAFLCLSSLPSSPPLSSSSEKVWNARRRNGEEGRHNGTADSSTDRLEKKQQESFQFPPPSPCPLSGADDSFLPNVGEEEAGDARK